MFRKTMQFVCGLMFIVLSNTSLAAIKSLPVEYSTNGTVMEGFLAYNDANKTPQPGIIIVPDWMGVGQFAKDKAVQLANQGYVVLVADVYGKGIRPKDKQEAAQFAAKYKDNRPLLRQRMKAAFDKLTSLKEVNAKQIMVMGYCFGGTAALELARSGVPLVGTVSFHGGLSNPTPQDAKNIKGRVLVLHGADDPNVPPAEVAAFKEEMHNAGVNLTFIAYKGAVHAFTNPAAGNDNTKGAAYNANADKQSWLELQKFMKTIFANNSDEKSDKDKNTPANYY